MLHYLQTVFGPDQNQLNRNLRSLKSLDEYLKKYPYDITLHAAGWCASDDLWNQVVELLQTVSFSYTLDRHMNNAGKSFVVNTLFDTYLKEHDDIVYFFTADSDICFDADLCPNLFERLMQAPDHITALMKKPFGMIALAQAEGDCHIHNVLTLNVTYTNTFGQVEKMSYHPHVGGIAGGCLFTTTANWKQVGGYRLINVYGGDDGFYLLDTYNTGKACVVSDTISIIHPNDTDVDYGRWKHAQIGNIHKHGGHSRPLDVYLQSESNATQFWANKPK